MPSKTKLAELGIKLGSEETLNTAFARFKELANKKREIFDKYLHVLVSDEVFNLTARPLQIHLPAHHYRNRRITARRNCV